MRLLTSGLVLALVTAAPMSAQAVDWTIGAGAGFAPDYEGSDDYEVVPLWNLRAQDLYHPATYVDISGPRLSSNFIPHDNFRLGLSGQYAFERDDVDDNKVDSLRDTDSGVLLGVIGGYDFDITPDAVLGLELDARFDVTGDVGGLITGRVKFRSPLDAAKDWIVNAGVETTFATDDYMDNYFGISARDLGSSSLSTFSADSGFKDVGLNAGITYMFTPSWSVTGLASYKRLLGDAKDSPVTDNAGDENQLFGGALVSFRF